MPVTYAGKLALGPSRLLSLSRSKLFTFWAVFASLGSGKRVKVLKLVRAVVWFPPTRITSVAESRLLLPAPPPSLLCSRPKVCAGSWATVVGQGGVGLRGASPLITVLAKTSALSSRALLLVMSGPAAMPLRPSKLPTSLPCVVSVQVPHSTYASRSPSVLCPA